MKGKKLTIEEVLYELSNLNATNFLLKDETLFMEKDEIHRLQHGSKDGLDKWFEFAVKIVHGGWTIKGVDTLPSE